MGRGSALDRKKLISHIAKYSALNTNSSNANNERNTYNFYIELPEEQEIRNKLSTAHVIILTGEAGDGKSRMLNLLMNEAISNGFTKIVDDFSQESQEEKESIIQQMADILDDKNNDKLLIGANIGLLVQYVLRSPRLSFESMSFNLKVEFINFERRNLSQDSDFFSRLITGFLGERVLPCQDRSCPHYTNCPFEQNFKALLEDRNVRENIRLLCNAVYLMGAHITLREMFSLLSSLVTGGYQCCDLPLKLDNYESFAYYNIFDKHDGVVLDKIKSLDPARSSLYDDASLYKELNFELKKFIYQKRKSFFQRGNNNYAHLPVAYLNEFNDLLHLLCRSPQEYDIAEPHPSIVKLKEGLVKLISPEKTDLEISFFDIPLPIHERIMTRFSIDFNEIPLVWRHPQWNPKDGITDSKNHANSINTLCLSGYYGDTLPSNEYTLSIGYDLFHQILLAGDNYFYPSSGNNLHKYGLFDFFRKILKEFPKYYKNVEIIFNDDQHCNFEMSYHIPNNKILGMGFSKRVQIKKI